MTQWITGRVVENRQWSERLHSLRIDADVAPFTAGQFTRLALEIDGEIVARPYSLVSAPDARPLDFYFSVVRNGKLSPRLASLQPGAEVLVASQAAGLLTLDELPAGKHLFLLSTGTGIGPFLSILKTSRPWQRFERVVLAHGVRLTHELSYQGTIRRLRDAYPQQFAYLPFVSREASATALAGRIPQAIADGQLETCSEVKIAAHSSQFMLCGNPQMVEDTVQVLQKRGLQRHRRSEPGHISVESYW